MCVSEISSHILRGEQINGEERYEKGQEQPQGGCVDSAGRSDCRPSHGAAEEQTPSTDTQ